MSGDGVGGALEGAVAQLGVVGAAIVLLAAVTVLLWRAVGQPALAAIVTAAKEATADARKAAEESKEAAQILRAMRESKAGTP